MSYTFKTLIVPKSLGALALKITDAIGGEHKGMFVAKVAEGATPTIGQPDTRVPVGYEIALAGFAGTDLSRQLGNPQGALPFTVMVGADGRVRQRHLGETNYAALAAWAAGG